MKAIAFSISVLLTTVMIIALVIGIAFLLYSVYTENISELYASGRLITVALTILIPSTATAFSLQRYIITEIVDAFIVIMLYWLVVPVASALIYWYTIGLDFVDALFESVSGFSGTGLTVISRLEEVPYVVLMWRAATQWIGELSVVVISGALLPHIHRVLSRVYIAERGVRLAPTILSTTRRMLAVYVVLTFLGTTMLMYSGMEPLDAVAHSMTGIATGGMSTKSTGIMYWYSVRGPLIILASTVIMVLGALNFADLYNLIRGRIKRFVKGLEVKWFAYIALVLSLAVVALSYIAFEGNANSMLIALYNTVSGLTTTGFQVGDLNGYPDTLKILIIVAMAIGGATFSTAGGVKIRRTAIAIKSIAWSMARPFLPERAYIVKRINGVVVDEEDVIAVYGFIALYIAVALASSIALHVILCVYNYSWSGKYIDALFETVSALSCVGLSVGITSAAMPFEAKVLLMAVMYLGRLEFVPLYLALGYAYRRKVTL